MAFHKLHHFFPLTAESFFKNQADYQKNVSRETILPTMDTRSQNRKYYLNAVMQHASLLTNTITAKTRKVYCLAKPVGQTFLRSMRNSWRCDCGFRFFFSFHLLKISFVHIFTNNVTFLKCRAIRIHVMGAFSFSQGHF